MNTVTYPAWLEATAWTLATVGGAFVLGWLANIVVAGRLTRLARTTEGQWDDILITALTSRIPLWSVLAGAWVSLGYWSIAERWLLIASRAITTLGLLSLTFAAAAVATGLTRTYGSRALPGVPVSGLTHNIVRLVVITCGLLIVLNGLGVEIRPMLAALGVGGLAVALALQEPLSNLFAGVFVTMAGQVRIGDHVRLDSGVEGRIVDFNWRSTSLEIATGNVAVVPNAKFSQAIVTNFNVPTPAINVPVEFVVSYASDAVTVESVALDVARHVLATTDGAEHTHEPLVRFSAFGDVGLRGTVTLRARSLADQAAVRHAYISRLHTAFRDRGIVIPTLVPLPK